MIDHDWHDDVAVYLLGALEDPEREAFEAQLAVSEDLRSDVAHLRVAADALPNSPQQLDPPPGLKARLMEIVNAEAELLAAADSRAPSAQPQPSSRPRRRIAGLLPGGWSIRPGIALAVSLIVLAVGGAGVVIGQSALSGGEKTQQVAGSDGQAQAKFIRREGKHSTLTATGLKPAGPGRSYQVWLQHAGEDPQPTNALFTPRADGTASVDVPGSLQGVDTVLVTNEPEGGSKQQPTTAPVIEFHPS